MVLGTLVAIPTNRIAPVTASAAATMVTVAQDPSGLARGLEAVGAAAAQAGRTFTARPG